MSEHEGMNGGVFFPFSHLSLIQTQTISALFCCLRPWQGGDQDYDLMIGGAGLHYPECNALPELFADVRRRQY